MRFDACDFPSNSVRVFVDGREVTEHCTAFDTEAGYALLSIPQLSGGRISGFDRQTLRGEVTSDPPQKVILRILRKEQATRDDERTNATRRLADALRAAQTQHGMHLHVTGHPVD